MVCMEDKEKKVGLVWMISLRGVVWRVSVFFVVLSLVLCFVSVRLFFLVLFELTIADGQQQRSSSASN